MQRRLTLFFHPGRIKRGVAPNLELGPALRRGETFRLVIDEALKDAMGYPLAAGFEKEIKVGPADRESPNQADWEVSAPTSADAPLILRFPEPLDYALLQRMITVERVGGGRVAGDVDVSKNETHWEFVSDTPWAPGEYVIRVDPKLEDVAGNTFLLFVRRGNVGPETGTSRRAPKHRAQIPGSLGSRQLATGSEDVVPPAPAKVHGISGACQDLHETLGGLHRRRLVRRSRPGIVGD